MHTHMQTSSIYTYCVQDIRVFCMFKHWKGNDTHFQSVGNLFLPMKG